MTSQSEIKQAFEKMEASLEHLSQEFAGLRVGRASTALVENILIESYGSKSPLKTVASITVSDAKTIMIQPWDRGILSDIDRSIRESELGVTPSNDGIALRITIPSLSEERRVELSKVVNKLSEETKVALRNARQEVHGNLKERQRKGEITEDDFYGIEKTLNDEIAKFNKRVDELADAKRKELMEV